MDVLRNSFSTPIPAHRVGADARHGDSGRTDNAEAHTLDRPARKPRRSRYARAFGLARQEAHIDVGREGCEQVGPPIAL
jgi:hypothetical protein